MPNDGGASTALTRVGNIGRRALHRPPSPRYETLAPGVESHIQHFDVDSITRLLGVVGFRVERVGVDDARPSRSGAGRAVFTVRRWLTLVTPWHWGREMLVIARPADA